MFFRRVQFTWACYGLGICALLHILAVLFTHWSVKFKALVCTAPAKDLDGADAVLVTPAKFSGTMEMVPLERRILVRWDKSGSSDLSADC